MGVSVLVQSESALHTLCSFFPDVCLLKLERVYKEERKKQKIDLHRQSSAQEKSRGAAAQEIPNPSE